MRTSALDFDPIDEARRQWASRWPSSALPMAAATSVMRAQQLVLTTIDRALSPFGLTFARFEALTLLSFSKTGALPIGKLGPRLMVHPTSVTNVVDRLEATGLVERRAHPTDRRVTLVAITDDGRATLRGATDAVNATSFGLGGLDDSDLESLVESIRALRTSRDDASSS
jgi:DNA-binding MarR family transcriptional regulator